MPAAPESGKYLDRVILLFLFALFLLLSPIAAWWSAPGSPWYLPYLLWLAVILLGFRLQRGRDRR